MSARSASDRTVPVHMTPTRVALRLIAAGLVCGAAVPLYVFLVWPVGYAMLAVGLLVAATVDRHLLRHLALITASLVVISTVSLAADLSNAGIASVVFVSFLWELGYQLWAPVFTIPFALLQGFIFQRTRSLAYVVTVHLSFDAIIFMILVHAHTPELFDLFVTSPR